MYEVANELYGQSHMHNTVAIYACDYYDFRAVLHREEVRPLLMKTMKLLNFSPSSIVFSFFEFFKYKRKCVHC